MNERVALQFIPTTNQSICWAVRTSSFFVFRKIQARRFQMHFRFSSWCFNQQWQKPIFKRYSCDQLESRHTMTRWLEMFSKALGLLLEKVFALQKHSVTPIICSYNFITWFTVNHTNNCLSIDKSFSIYIFRKLHVFVVMFFKLVMLSRCRAAPCAFKKRRRIAQTCVCMRIAHERNVCLLLAHAHLCFLHSRIAVCVSLAFTAHHIRRARNFFMEKTRNRFWAAFFDFCLPRACIFS